MNLSFRIIRFFLCVLVDRCKAIVCDTTWSETRWFATFKHDNEVNVWDLNTATVIRGHRAHCDKSGAGTSRQQHQQSNDAAAMCITLNREILTITANGFVKFCLRSNTYSLFRDDFVARKRRCRVSALKASPNSADIVGIGYNDGLVEVVNIASELITLCCGLLMTHTHHGNAFSSFAFFLRLFSDPTILRTFKGHNTSIVSMQWMQIPTGDITNEPISRIQKRLSSETASSSSNSNMSIDPPENQPQNDQSTSSEEQIEMDDVNETKGSESTVSEEETVGGPVLSADTAAREHQVKQQPAENPVEMADATQPAKTVATEDDNRYYLATGAEEPRVYIWDIKNNIIAHTINLKTHKKSSIPSMYCSTSSNQIIDQSIIHSIFFRKSLSVCCIGFHQLN